MIYWELFSKKLREKIDHFRFAGSFTPEIAEEKGMRYVKGVAENIAIYWLVDETDGIIADAKFQAYGPIALLAALEIASELAIRKNYTQVSRISADLIDQHVRDRKETPAFPKECSSHLNEVLSAIDSAVSQCLDIPYAESYDMTPIESDFGEIPGGIPGWDNFPKGQKMHIVEEVINREIRPYIELDAGGIRLVDLHESGEVEISYEGACTSCHASTGSTLSAIQKILKARVHPSLIVVPKI